MKPNAFTFLQRGCAQVSRLGWRLLWHRYITRLRILNAGTIKCPDGAKIEVHMQVCARDWLNALWTLRSFRRHCGRHFQLLLLCDHTVTDAMQAKLRHRLPGADVLPCEHMSGAVKATFAEKYPELYRLRCDPRFVLMPKVTDSFALRRKDVVLMIDPDVLFFDEPRELLRDLDPARGYFGRYNVPQRDADPASAFSLDAETLREKFGVQLPPRFNAGLGSVNYTAADWDWIEQIVKTVPPDPERAFLIEQTIFWLLGARGGLRELPPDRYAIEPVPSLRGVVARHYYAKTRDLFYVEGIPELMRRGLLRDSAPATQEPITAPQ